MSNLPDYLQPQHRRTIEKLVERFGDNPAFPALIVGGSIVKGLARPDSDVDIILIATDEEYARREAAGEYWFFDRSMVDYPGGYIDGKVVDQAFLKDVAARGSEPARSAFEGALPAYSRIPELESVLAQITAYPEHERADKLRSFYSQVMLLGWYVGEAVKREDRYLLTKMSVDMAFYACRVVLAHNRMLYPYHKWLMEYVRRAPQRPAGFLEAVDALIADPGKETAEAVRLTLAGWLDWDVSWNEAVVRFMKDAEWNWRTGATPLTDR